MSTMYVDRLIAIILGLGFMVPIHAGAQAPSADTAMSFRIGIDIGAGYAAKLNSTNKLPGNYTPGGLAASIRVKWGSRNVFGAGIETGWLQISSLSASGASTSMGTTNIEASLNATPLLFIVAMQRFNMQLHAGVGYYRVRAAATVFESTAESGEWDFGYMLALGYTYALGTDVKVGAEVKWNNISEVQVSLLSFQARVLINLWEW